MGFALARRKSKNVGLTGGEKMQSQEQKGKSLGAVQKRGRRQVKSMRGCNIILAV